MQDSSGPLFPCIANVANVSLYSTRSVGSDDTSGFLRAILLQLCTSLWNLVGQKYLDLREQLLEPSAAHGRGTEISAIRRVYSQLMRMEDSVNKVFANSLGLGAGIKGEMKEEITTGTRSLNVLPFEFAEFLDEPTVEVLHRRGYQRIVFCATRPT